MPQLKAMEQAGRAPNTMNYLARTLRPAIISRATRWAVIERRRLINDGMTKADATAQALAEARKLCGLAPHHVRHTTVALLSAAGASDIKGQPILGHRGMDTSKQASAAGIGESVAERVEQLREALQAS